MLKHVLITASVLLFLPNLFNTDINGSLPYDQKEEFEPGLAYINSIHKLDQHVDSISPIEKNEPLNYIIALESVIRKRFYHGYSHFTLSENWIAAISGKTLEYGLACKVLPEDIVQQSTAACSQQALVMMAILRKKNISYRSVGFPHHYALEVLVNGKWYYCDPNMEPRLSIAQRNEDSWQHNNDSLKQYYDTGRFKDLDFKFGVHLKATHGPINEIPAPNARLFQSLTGVLSKTIWCFPLLLLLCINKDIFRSSENNS